MSYMYEIDSKNSPDTREQHPTVLVVEDEPNAREASRLYLEHRGHQVFTAADATTAIQKAEQNDVDVLVCDWRLGAGGDGAQVAREIQQRFETPVIFVTAYPIDELLAATADIRVSRYLKKPVSLAALADAIALASYN